MADVVYIAGCLERAAEACDVAATLRARGIHVSSNWHDRLPDRAKEERLPRVARADIAAQNERDLRAATMVLWLADPRSRGALVEVGIACGLGLRVYGAGDHAAVTLMALVPCIDWYTDTDAAVRALVRAAGGEALR